MILISSAALSRLSIFIICLALIFPAIMIAATNDKNVKVNQRKRRLPTNRQAIKIVGATSYIGDGKPAKEIPLNSISNIVIDSTGNIFIGDLDNSRVRKIDAVTGIITTVAGNGSKDSSGDGGRAIVAGLSPSCLAFDSKENLYISENRNKCIRRIDAKTGIITTVAKFDNQNSVKNGSQQTSINEPSSIVIDKANNIYVLEAHLLTVFRVDAITGTISTIIDFSDNDRNQYLYNENFIKKHPRIIDINIDHEGNLLLLDLQNTCIYQLNAFGVRGRIDLNINDASFNPAGFTLSQLAIDKTGNWFVTEQYNNQVYRVDRDSGMLTNVIGRAVIGNDDLELGDNGPAINAVLEPGSIAFDNQNNTYIVDRGFPFLKNNSGRSIWSIRRVDAISGLITTIAGGDHPIRNSHVARVKLDWPHEVVVDQKGNLFIADTGNNIVRKVDAKSRRVTTIAGNGRAFNDTSHERAGSNGRPATEVSLKPFDLALDHTGNIFIVDSSNSCIRRVDAKTNIITTVAGTGISKLDSGHGDGDLAINADLNSPYGIVIDEAGNLYIADTGHGSVRRVDAKTGIISTIFTTRNLDSAITEYLDKIKIDTPKSYYSPLFQSLDLIGLSGPNKIDLDSEGNLFILYPGAVSKLNLKTNTVKIVAAAIDPDTYRANKGEIKREFAFEDITVDTVGNLFLSYRTEKEDERESEYGIKRLDAQTGNISTIISNQKRENRAGQPGLDYLTGLSFDKFGNLFITDTGNEAIRVIKKVDSRKKRLK